MAKLTKNETESNGDYISSDMSVKDKNSWATPHWLFNALDKEFHFNIDVCASYENKKCEYFISEDQDALSSNWFIDLADTGERYTAWCNPPYSRGMIGAFLRNAREEMKNGIDTVFLIPATPDASWFPTDADEIRFITNGRVSFINPITGKETKNPPKGSCLAIFRHDSERDTAKVSFVDRDEIKGAL